MSCGEIFDYKGFIDEWEPLTIAEKFLKYLGQNDDADLRRFQKEGNSVVNVKVYQKLMVEGLF